MKSGTLSCIAAVVFTCIIPRIESAHAQPDRDEQARTLFLAGRTYFEQGEYELAREQFKRAYDLSHRPALLINISLTAERTGDLEEAIESLEKYLREVPNAQDRETQEERLGTMRRRLERRRAEQPEEEPTTTPAPAPATPQPMTSLETTPPTRNKVIPDAALASYIAGGVGVLMFGTFGVLTLVEDKNLKDKCGKTTSCEDSDLSKLHTYGILADVGIGIAVTGAVIGTTFLLLHKKKARHDNPQARVKIVPYAGPLSGGATATVSF